MSNTTEPQRHRVPLLWHYTVGLRFRQITRESPHLPRTRLRPARRKTHRLVLDRE
jgi:hypothetical protein